MKDACADPEFKPLAEDFKRKLISLVNAYLENGVLEIDELRYENYRSHLSPP